MVLVMTRSFSPSRTESAQSLSGGGGGEVGRGCATPNPGDLSGRGAAVEPQRKPEADAVATIVKIAKPTVDTV